MRFGEILSAYKFPKHSDGLVKVQPQEDFRMTMTGSINAPNARQTCVSTPPLI